MLRLIVSTVVIAALAGCGEAAKKPETTPAPPAASTAVASTAAAPATAAPALSAEIAPGIPRLNATGASSAAFAPSGWTVEQQVAGDINQDGVPDLAFVLRKTDPAGVISREGFEPSNINPRILAVVLGSPAGFTLVGQTHTLIPTRDADGLNMEEPFDGGLSIQNGALVIEVSLFMSMGGADAGRYKFKCRYQDGAVRLIGYDRQNVQRMTGETTTVSANLLTGRVTTATGSIETDKERTVTSSTSVRGLPMDQIGDAFSFEYDKLGLST